MAPPKAILFDIGGVCVCTPLRSMLYHTSLTITAYQVISPFQAILDYERENGIPIGYINYAIQKGPADTGAWQLIERGEVELNDLWFQNFEAQLSRPEVWREYWAKARAAHNGSGSSTAAAGAPPVPAINGKKLFWRMMRISREPDPYMYPALKALQASGRFALGALSNTVAFPTGILDDEGVLFNKSLIHPAAPHPHADHSTDIADCFDIFISSAHVGVRKPDPAAYALAVRELDRIARAKGLGAVEATDVLFLDDIGINLKFARQSGLRTIKVNLGETRDAVRELEAQTEMNLLGDARSRL